MAVFSAVRTMAEHWWVVLLRGILAILFGVLAYTWPGLTILILVTLWGAYALVDGIFGVVAGVRGKWGSLVVIGLIGIAAGVVAFLWPGLTAVTLLWILAFWAIVAGVLQISAAIRLRKEVQGEWLWILSGILTIGARRPVLPLPRGGNPLGDLAHRRAGDRVGDPARHAVVQAEGTEGEARGAAGLEE